MAGICRKESGLLLVMMCAWSLAVPALGGIVEFQVDVGLRYEPIKPIWDALNLWAPTFILDANGNPNNWYRDTHPFVKRLVLMTATGGRRDFPEVEILRRDASGDLYYDFSTFDRCLEAVVELGYRPIVVIASTPFALAPENYRIGSFGAVVDPPVDYDAWHEFVYTVIRHAVERYGREEVQKWVWRLFTEPDNSSWWLGSKEDYFRLYDYTVDAALRALPGICIGPGNMLGEIEGHWGLEILDHVFAGKNYYTGETGTYIRFFTISAYERCERDFPPLARFEERLRVIKEKLRSYGSLDTVAIGFDEGQLLFDEDDRYLWLGDGTEYGASWQAAYQILGIRQGLDRIVQWGFTSDGVKTPKYNVIEMLEKLKGQVRVAMTLARDEREGLAKTLLKIEGIASVPEDGSSLSVLLYSHFKYRDPGGLLPEYPQPVRVVVRRLPFRTVWVRLTHYLVDSTHSNFFNKWLEDSKPLRRVPPSGIGGSIYDADVLTNLTPEGRAFWYAHRAEYLQIDDLETAGPPQVLPVLSDGSVRVDLGMRAHQVSLLVLEPEGGTGVLAEAPSDCIRTFTCSVFPNPFNECVTVEVQGVWGQVELGIFNLWGREVYSTSAAAEGRVRFVWDARAEDGENVPSGLYIVRVESGEGTLVRRAVLLR